MKKYFIESPRCAQNITGTSLVDIQICVMSPQEGYLIAKLPIHQPEVLEIRFVYEGNYFRNYRLWQLHRTFLISQLFIIG